MRTLPLYSGDLSIESEKTTGLDLNSSCDRCPLNREHLRHACIAADASEYEEGEPTLLVVGDFPSLEDDGCGRIMTTASSQWLRREIEARWKGSLVYDVGVRCAPGGVSPKPDWVNACRPYLASTVAEAKPTRIITLGAYAGRAVLGRQVPPLSVRRGYAYTSNGSPVFMLMSPGEAQSNRFKRKWMVEDLDWALSAEPKPPPTDAVCRVVETAEDARAAVEDLRKGPWVTYDCEWSGLMFDGTDGYYRLLCLAMSRRGDPNPYVWSEEALNDPERWAPLANLLADESVPKGGQNLKADVMAVRAKKWAPINVRGIAYDLLLTRKGFASDIDGSLDFAAELVGMGGHKEENDAYVKEAVKQIKYARDQFQKGVQFTPGIYSSAIVAAVNAHHDISPKAWAYAEVPTEILWRYCARDVVSTDLVADVIWPQVEDDDEMQRVNDVFIRPATTAFAQVEAWGMAFDTASNRRTTTYLAHEIEKLEKAIAKHGDLNPNSDQDKARFLYEELGLPIVKRTKNDNPSVDAEALKQLQDKHPVVSKLIDHNELTTIQNTFAAGMARHVRGDGRIHTDFRLSGTRSGRLSSGEPNLQNIPSRNPELAKMVKDCFIAPPGRMLLQLDYSQLEYRVAAMLSGDPVFSQIFIDGHDAHRRTAELVAPYTHGITVEQAAAMSEKEIKGMRSDAKKINFGVLYGKTVRTLARDLGCSIDQAQKLFDIIMGKFAVLKDWLDEQIAYTRRTGICWTYLVDEEGPKRFQRRQLYNIAGPDDGAASKARNGSVNTPIQGTAAGYMNRTVINVVDWFLADHIPGKVVNTVHDSIIEEVDVEFADEVALTTRDIMEGFPSGDVPLRADMEVGYSWGSMVGVSREGDQWRFKTKAGEPAFANTLVEVLEMAA